jgi:hypothetical protein
MAVTVHAATVAWRHVTYKDHRFVMSKVGKGWRAMIYAPRSLSPLPEKPTNLEQSSNEAIIAEAQGRLDLLPKLATELVAANVDILVALYTPCARAAQQANIPPMSRKVTSLKRSCGGGFITSPHRMRVAPATPVNTEVTLPFLCWPPNTAEARSTAQRQQPCCSIAPR